VPLKYQSGEEIRKGDRVLFHGEPGEIEFIADPLVKDPESDWYVHEYGGDVMVIEPKLFGRAFSDAENAEDLILVSRSAEPRSAARS
jgi:hypothetical protein